MTIFKILVMWLKNVLLNQQNLSHRFIWILLSFIFYNLGPHTEGFY